MSLKSFSKTQEIEKRKETTAMQLHLEKMLVSCGSPILPNKKEKRLCQGCLAGALTFPSPFQTAWPPIWCLFYLVTEKSTFQHIACKEAKCHFLEGLCHVSWSVCSAEKHSQRDLANQVTAKSNVSKELPTHGTVCSEVFKTEALTKRV